MPQSPYPQKVMGTATIVSEKVWYNLAYHAEVSLPPMVMGTATIVSEKVWYNLAYHATQRQS